MRCGQCEGFESVGKCEYLEDHGTYHSCKVLIYKDFVGAIESIFNYSYVIYNPSC